MDVKNVIAGCRYEEIQNEFGEIIVFCGTFCYDRNWVDIVVYPILFWGAPVTESQHITRVQNYPYTKEAIGEAETEDDTSLYKSHGLTE